MRYIISSIILCKRKKNVDVIFYFFFLTFLWGLKRFWDGLQSLVVFSLNTIYCLAIKGQHLNRFRDNVWFFLDFFSAHCCQQRKCDSAICFLLFAFESHWTLLLRNHQIWEITNKVDHLYNKYFQINTIKGQPFKPDLWRTILRCCTCKLVDMWLTITRQ